MKAQNSFQPHIRAPIYMNALQMLPKGSNSPLSGSAFGNNSIGAGATLSLAQILQPPEATAGWDLLLLSNYMIDLEWLFEQSGGPKGFQQVAVPIVQGKTRFQLLYGESSQDHLVAAMHQATAKAISSNLMTAGAWTKTATFTKPRLPLSYGTHHTKAMVAIKKGLGVRVGVFTANFIKDDWDRKNQGLFVQDFPWVQPGGENVPSANGEVFRQELLTYLQDASASADILAELNRVPSSSSGGYNFSAAQGRLVSSAPGYHQVASPSVVEPLPPPPFTRNFKPLSQFQGMERLRKVLSQEAADPVLAGQAVGQTCLSWQYSSQGSLTDRFLGDLQRVMNTTNSGSSGKTPFDVVAAAAKSAAQAKGNTSGAGGVRVVFPTEDEVKHSVEGWRGGSSIPVPVKNAHEFVNERLHKFACPLATSGAAADAEYHPRTRAMPHIKSFLRLSPSTNSVPGGAWWVLVTSSNLSRAAWGDYQKNNTQLAIRSYELGVLFTAQSVLRGRQSPHADFSMFPVQPSTAAAAAPQVGLSASTPTTHGLWPVRLIGEGTVKRLPTPEVYLTLPYNAAQPVPYASTALLRAGKPLTLEAKKDVPWMVDAPHRGHDALGQDIGSALGEYSHYGSSSWNAATLHFENWKAPALPQSSTVASSAGHQGVLSLVEQALSRELEAVETTLPPPPAGASPSASFIPSGALLGDDVIVISSDTDDEADGAVKPEVEATGSSSLELLPSTQDEEVDVDRRKRPRE